MQNRVGLTLGVVLAALIGIVLYFFLFTGTNPAKVPPNAPDPAAESVQGGGASGDDSAAPADRTDAIEKPRAELVGRFGRIAVEFPEGADCAQTEIRVYAPSNAQTPMTSRYGSGDLDVMAGQYDVEISGVRQSVEVAARQQLNIRVGVLRVKTDEKTLVNVLDSTGANLAWHYGSFDFGLPAGEYQVEMGGQVRAVRIVENEITLF